MVTQENCAVGMVIGGLDYLYVPFFYVESSKDIPESIMSCPIKYFLALNEIVKHVTLVLQMFLNEDPIVEHLLHCDLSGSETCLFF